MSLLGWCFVAAYGAVHLLSVVAGALALRRAIRRGGTRAEDGAETPSVSLVIAIHDVAEHSRTCLNSLIEQEYHGEIEIVFAAQTPDDPALPFVADLIAASARSASRARRVRTSVEPVEPGFTAAASNFAHGLRMATGDVVVLCTDDVIAPRSAVRALIDRLAAGADLVSALPLFVAPQGLAARIYSQFYNVAAVLTWAPAVDAGTGAAWGGMMATPRATLDAVGGYEVTRGRIADDLELARAFTNAGLRCAVGPTLRSPVGDRSWAELRSFFLRMGYMGARESPTGAPLTLFVFAAQYAYLGFLPAGLAFGNPAWMTLGAACLVIRVAYATAAGYLVGDDRRLALSFLLADALHVASLATASFTNRLHWAGETYRMDRAGWLHEG